MNLYALLLLMGLTVSSFAKGTDLKLRFAVKSDLDALFQDTVNEGDRIASVKWVTENGKKSPDVSCKLLSVTKSIYSCSASIRIKLEGVSGYATETCEALKYVWDGKNLKRISTRKKHENTSFDDCLEQLNSAEI